MAADTRVRVDIHADLTSFTETMNEGVRKVALAFKALGAAAAKTRLSFEYAVRHVPTDAERRADRIARRARKRRLLRELRHPKPRDPWTGWSDLGYTTDRREHDIVVRPMSFPPTTLTLNGTISPEGRAVLLGEQP